MSNYNSTARSLRDHSTPAQVDDNGYLEYVEFRNVVPRTREERRNMTDKETLEKSRLMKRRQGYFHYEDLGKITVPDKDAAAKSMCLGSSPQSARLSQNMQMQKICKHSKI